MKFTSFDPPGNNGDFDGNPALAAKWSTAMSANFTAGVKRATDTLTANGGGVCQFYNPVTHGRTDPDLAPADIFWNGFPRKNLGHGVGAVPDFATAEAAVAVGQARDQDEYLEWHVVRNAANKITSVQFTCEGYDYYEFLGREDPNFVVKLYQDFIDPAITKSQLFSGTTYNKLNRWNTRDGAMHLTQSANNLFAEVILAAEATVRRKNTAGTEVTSADALCKCGNFGDDKRNSDPAIGAGVNALVRQGRMITLVNPVGLYIDHLDDSGFSLPDGSGTAGWFNVLRGTAGRTMRAVFAPPAGSAFTVSDVKIGGVALKFGGQIAQKITMKLTGVASIANTIHNSPVGCVGSIGGAPGYCSIGVNVINTKPAPRRRLMAKSDGHAATAKRPAIREPLLDVGDIQGNILAGFNKDHQQLIALDIVEVEDAKRWLARIQPEISSLAEVHLFNELFRTLSKRRGHDPEGLVATWMNLAFSREGIAKLASEADANALSDKAFQLGLGIERSKLLHDPPPPGEFDPTARWVVGGTNRAPHIFMIVASDSMAELASAIQRLLPGPADGKGAPKIVWQELGETRVDQPGHEHFGFKDGVSQPGIRGLISRQPRVELTPRLLNKPAADEIEFAKPGQPLIWPGQFVLGYVSGDSQDGKPVPVKRSGRASDWFNNGSYLVFRRLSQNVAGFKAFLAAKATELSAQPGFTHLSADRLGAMLVGRWPSGAPVSRVPAADNASLAADSLSNNDFIFNTDTPAPDFRTGVNAMPGKFARAMEGTNGPVCPHAAHILKVNPRDLATNVGNPFDTLTRRILRRGIPFGPSLLEPDKGDDGVERGLHFLCYQASIVDQFEFLQQDWANNNGAPTAGGHDLIIGQTADQQRSVDLAAIVPGQIGQTITAMKQWVTPTGGGYFFSPSISAIREWLEQ